MDNNTASLFALILNQGNYMHRRNKAANRSLCAFWKLLTPAWHVRILKIQYLQFEATQCNEAECSFTSYFYLCLFCWFCGWLPCRIFSSNRLTLDLSLGSFFFFFSPLPVSCIFWFSTFILYFLLYCHFSSSFFLSHWSNSI